MCRVYHRVPWGRVRSPAQTRASRSTSELLLRYVGAGAPTRPAEQSSGFQVGHELGELRSPARTRASGPASTVVVNTDSHAPETRHKNIHATVVPGHVSSDSGDCRGSSRPVFLT